MHVPQVDLGVAAYGGVFHMTDSGIEELKIDWIQSRVMIDPNSGCWLWTGATSGGGYGFVSRNGRRIAAHRLSYQIVNGPIADGLFICHKCDTPPCVRPDHLFAGTHTENMLDSSAKRRHWMHRTPERSPLFEHRVQVVGEDHYMAMVSDLQVREIRFLRLGGMTYPAIGRRYGVTEDCIGFICRGVSRLSAGGPTYQEIKDAFAAKVAA